jgi:hypothetical protein
VGDAVRAKLTSSNVLSLSISSAMTTGTVEWQVVTFDGAAVQTGDVNLAGNATSVTATLASAVDPAKTWVLLSYTDTNFGGTPAEFMVSSRVTSPTQLTVQRAGAGASCTMTWYAVYFNNGTTVQTGTSTFAGTVTTATAALTPVDPLKTIAAAGGLWHRGGTTAHTATNNPGYGTFTLDVGTGSLLTLTRGASGGTATCTLDWSVVNFF